MKKSTVLLVLSGLVLTACSQLPLKTQVKPGHFRLENFSADYGTQQDRVYVMCYRNKPTDWAEPKQYQAGEHQLWVKARIEDQGLVKNLRVAHVLLNVKLEAGKSYLLNRQLDQDRITIWIQDSSTGAVLSEQVVAALTKPLLVEENLRKNQCRQGSI